MRSDPRIVYANDAFAHPRQEGIELVRILGWLMVLLAIIPALFIWIGLGVGSMFWVWWTVVQAFAGLSVIALSASMQARFARSRRRAVYRLTTEEEAEYAAENYEPRAA